MAALAGDDLTRGAIYMFETGRARPSRQALELIAKRSGKPLSYFLSDADQLGVALGVASDLARLELAVASGNDEDATALARRLMKQPLHPAAAGRVHLATARVCASAGRFEDALADAREAARLAADDSGHEALEIGARLIEAQALHRLGDVRARTAAGEALALSRRTDGSEWIASALLAVLGAVELEDGDPAAAAEALEQAFAARPTVGALRDAAAEASAAGDEQTSAGREAEAATAYARATTLRDVADALAAATETAIMLATARLAAGDSAGARDAFASGIELASSYGLEADRLRAQLGLAELAIEQGDPDDARREADAIMAAAERTGDRRTLGAAYFLQARLAADSGASSEADRLFRRALAEFDSVRDLDRLYLAHSAYAELLETRGKVRQALDHWKAAASLSQPREYRRFDARVPPSAQPFDAEAEARADDRGAVA